MKRQRGAGTVERMRGKWRARFPIRPGERIEVGTFDTPEAAHAALDALLYEIAQSGKPRARTVNQAGDRHLDLRETSGFRAVRSERNRWATYVRNARIGNMPLCEVTAGDVRRWLASLSTRRLATQTQRNALILLRGAFALAVEDGWIPTNPCDGVKVREHGKTRETSTFLSADEARSLLSASGRASEVVIALFTGLRQGEQRSLQWQDVHADRITVRYGAPNKPTKSGKLRVVPLLPEAADAFASMRRGKPNALVFPAHEGGARTQGKLVPREDWVTWLRAAGLARRVRWHDLRHTCATLLLSGAWGRVWTLAEVQQMLGHASITTTERYARNLDSTLLAAAAGHYVYPAITPQTASVQGNDTEGNALKEAENLRSRFRGSNSRPTVYETVHDTSDIINLPPDLGYLRGDERRFAPAFSAAFDAADRFAWALEAAE